jgi:hypothetical protein
MGEVVGLGLRNLAHCPVELNLIPETTRRWQSFNEKKPYLIATVFSLVAVVGAMGLLFQKLASVKEQELSEVTKRLTPLQEKAAQFQQAYANLKAVQGEEQQLTTWIQARSYWAHVLEEMRRALIRTEQACYQKLNRLDNGVWVEQFLTMTPRAQTTEFPGVPGMPGVPGAPGSPYSGGPSPGMTRRYGQPAPDQQAVVPVPSPTGETIPGLPGPETPISTITLICRAVNLQNVIPDANTTIIYTLESELKADPLFDPKGTQLNNQPPIATDEATGTFSFGVTVQLKEPLKL